MANVEENRLFIKEVARQLMPYLLQELEATDESSVKDQKEG